MPVIEQLSHEITVERILELGQFSGGPCLSIYTPIVTAGPQVRQNEIRVSNQLKEAEELLQEAGLDSDDAQRVLQPLTELQNELQEPSGQRFPGIVSFLSPEKQELFPLPVEVDEMVFAGPRFITRPLLPFIDAPSVVYTLSLSLGEAKLYAMYRDNVEEVRPDDMPRSLDELAALEDPEKSVQQHSAGSDTMFHGHGASKDLEDDIEQDYIRRVASAVEKHMAEKNVPLLLAATEQTVNDFKSAFSYERLLDEPITGNVEHLSAAQLRDEAWKRIDESLARSSQESRGRFLDLASSVPDGVTRGVIASVQLAYQGQVNELLFPESLSVTGVFDGESGAAEEAEQSGVRMDDLVDLAAIFTLQNGGTVQALTPESQEEHDQLPQEMIAVLRGQ